MTRPPKDIAASVRAKLANLAEKNGEDFNLILVRYAIERFLFRLAASKHAKSFVLKGAMLFLLWEGHPHRPTRDLDLLGYGEASIERLEEACRAMCLQAVEPDGLQFEPESVRAEAIAAVEEYGGIRIKFRARLGAAKISLQVDIGFGDAITPEAETVTYPTLLDMQAPVLRAYPMVTAIAEKTEAIVRFGMLNSRFKDYYDLDLLATKHSFDGRTLQSAFRATFGRRGTPLPKTLPVGVSAEFARDATKQKQWSAFCGKNGIHPVQHLAEVVDRIAAFVGSPLLAATGEMLFTQHWAPSAGWHKRTS